MDFFSERPEEPKNKNNANLHELMASERMNWVQKKSEMNEFKQKFPFLNRENTTKNTFFHFTKLCFSYSNW